jgi:hypothetical protein
MRQRSAVGPRVPDKLGSLLHGARTSKARASDSCGIHPAADVAAAQNLHSSAHARVAPFASRHGTFGERALPSRGRLARRDRGTRPTSGARPDRRG